MYAIYNGFDAKIFESKDKRECLARAEEWGILDGIYCYVVDGNTGEILAQYEDFECLWVA